MNAALDRLKAHTASTAQAPTEEKLFQHYSSSRKSMRMITHLGKRIVFISHQLITADQAVIDYLDEQINSDYNPGLKKGKKMTAEDADPMSALKKKHIAEYLAKEAKDKADMANGILAPMGSTAGAKNLGAATSSQVAD